ncbi:hypothetical protein [Mesorhizobium sp.]|uniref:hypothetical protein n=1 Tax=Mesorhizobium sp. TaxID=1871066 RepID=UPI0025C73619|nr:hypothetical protein [Mesorhizobium sp.]
MIRALLAALLLTAPAFAADMSVFVRNQRSDGVALELFSRDSEKVWPGGDKVFLIRPQARKSVPISCEPGEHICWGAWVVGNDSVTAGVGPDNDQPWTPAASSASSIRPRRWTWRSRAPLLPLWEKVARRAAPRRMRGVGRSAMLENWTK